MKFIQDVSLRKTGEGLAMIYHKSEGTLFELNETATAIAELIAQDETMTVQTITNQLQQIYDASEHEIRQEVDGILAEFIEYGILEE